MNAQRIIRSFEAKIDDVSPKERAVISKIGGMAVDRHRTRISPNGISLDAYRSNPIVLHEHGRCPSRGTMPVGKNQWIKCDGERIIAKTIFKDDQYSIDLFNAYKDEWMRGWSINVIASEGSPPTAEEIRAVPSLKDECDYVFRRSELIEYSTTSMPSHRDALTLMVERGIWIPDDVLKASVGQSITAQWLTGAAKEAADAVLNRTTVVMPGATPPLASDTNASLTGGSAVIKPDDAEEDEKPRDEFPPGPTPGTPGSSRTATDSLGGMAGGGAAVKPSGDDEPPPYGYCPECGAPGFSRERRRNGNDECEAGHVYPSKTAKPQPRSAQAMLTRRIVEDDGKFFVESEDGSKRLGGPYGSREQAEKRLKQVETFKHADKEEEPRTGVGGSQPQPKSMDDEPVDDTKTRSLDGDPVAFDQHGGWRVRGLGDLSFPDEATARRAWEIAQQQPRTLTSAIREYDGAAERRNALVMKEMQTFFDLKIRGIV